MYELMVKGEFAAAHNLRGYRGLCENLHGHNWRVEITLASAGLDKTGMAMDFKEIKALLRQVLGELDHVYLNDLPAFAKANPTTENLARHIAEKLAALLPAKISVTRAEVWESERCGAAYIPSAKPRRGAKKKR